MFKHDLLKKYEIEQINSPNGRKYNTPAGEFMSVTTALSKLSKKQIEQWKKNVGNQRAREITNVAKLRGTALHDLCERYCLNDPDYASSVDSLTLAEFSDIKKYLDTHCNLVYGTELPLFSNTLRLAGTTDLVCKWDNINTVVDYKTARSSKTAERMLPHIAQATAYCMMIEEMYGLECPQFVIFIKQKHHHPEPRIMQYGDYRERVVSLFKHLVEGK
jgi:genome maintenance exonuclease 1